MSDRKTGGPAFPTHGGTTNENGERFDDPRNQIIGGGMTMRQWYAGMALQGLVMPQTFSLEFNISEALYARSAFDLADAMLAAEALP